jgi:hypothetical protein
VGSSSQAVATKAVNVCSGSWLRENSEIEFANGNFVSPSINLKNKSVVDSCRDKTIEKTILRAFRARTFSRSQGQSRPCRDDRYWRKAAVGRFVYLRFCIGLIMCP